MIFCSLFSVNSLVVFSHLYIGIMLKLPSMHFAKCSLTFNCLYFSCFICSLCSVTLAVPQVFRLANIKAVNHDKSCGSPLHTL